MPIPTLSRLAAAAMGAMLCGCMAVSVALAPVPLTLASGTPGADYHPVGNAVCRMFNLAAASRAQPCVALSSGGSVENIRRIESGEAALGLAQLDVAIAAFQGEGPFASSGANPRLRVLISLHSEAFTAVVRAGSGMRDFGDLRGKRVGVGKGGAGYPLTRDLLLMAHGMTIGDLGPVTELDPAGQERALCGDQVDAVLFVAGHPNGVTQATTTGCRARLLRVAGEPVNRLVSSHPAYVETVIPGGMYAGNPDAVPTIGTRAVLVAAEDLPDEVAYAVVKAILGNMADFRRLHPVLSPLEPAAMVPRAGPLPIHPGALAYYREAGLLP